MFEIDRTSIQVMLRPDRYAHILPGIVRSDSCKKAVIFDEIRVDVFARTFRYVFRRARRGGGRVDDGPRPSPEV